MGIKLPPKEMIVDEIIGKHKVISIAADTNVGGPEATAPLPVLPIDMWFHAMSFFKRSWWAVK